MSPEPERSEKQLKKELSEIKTSILDARRIEPVIKGQFTLDPVKYALYDEQNRLHSTDQAAIEWTDGRRGYFIEGVNFDVKTWAAIVTRTIRPEEAIKLTNQEQRRIAIKRIGFEKILTGLSAKIIDSNKDYQLIEAELYDDKVLHYETINRAYVGGKAKITRRRYTQYLPALFLKCKDSTTSETYFLRVPPNMRNCKQAVAWTFGFEKLVPTFKDHLTVSQEQELRKQWDYGYHPNKET